MVPYTRIINIQNFYSREKDIQDLQKIFFIIIFRAFIKTIVNLQLSDNLIKLQIILSSLQQVEK